MTGGTPAPSPPPSLDPGRRAAIAAAISGVAIVGIGLSLAIPLLSLEMERMGASGALIGVNTAVSGLTGILVVPFVPAAAARLGGFRLLVGGVVLGAVTLVGFRALPSLPAWFLLRFLNAAALGAIFVLSEYWISAASPPARRGLVMGVYATVLALGFAVGPTVLGLVGTRGWPPYLAGAALFLAAGLPLALARRALPPVERASRHGFGLYLRAAPAATFAALVYGAVETGAFAILPLYGLRLGYAADEAALLVSAVALGNVLFQIPIGLLSDRFDRRRLLLAAAGVGLVGALLLPLAAASAAGLAAVLFAWGGVAGSLYTVGLAHLGARFTGPELAGANAAFLALYNAGLVLGPPLVGGAMDLASPQGFAWSLAGLFGLYLALVAGRLRAPGGGRPA